MKQVANVQEEPVPHKPRNTERRLLYIVIIALVAALLWACLT